MPPRRRAASLSLTISGASAGRLLFDQWPWLSASRSPDDHLNLSEPSLGSGNGAFVSGPSQRCIEIHRQRWIGIGEVGRWLLFMEVYMWREWSVRGFGGGVTL